MEITTIFLKIRGLEAIEFDCPLDSPTLVELCRAWTGRASQPDLVMHLQLGEGEDDNLYFRLADLEGLESSLELPADYFLPGAEPSRERELAGKEAIGWDWQGWTRQNMAAGKDREALYRFLLDRGIDVADIEDVVGWRPAEPPPIPALDNREPVTPLQAGIADRYRFPSDYIELYEIPGFLSADEVAAVHTLVGEELYRSPVIGDNPVHPGRTSHTYRFTASDLAHPVLCRIRSQLSDMLGLETIWAEEMTSIVYREGEEFVTHRDYILDASLEFESPDGEIRQGQRMWSVLVYLTDATRGAGTHFHRLRHTFNPAPGTALLWNNLYPSGNPNPYTLHAGQRVGPQGKRVLTQMFRCPPAPPG